MTISNDHPHRRFNPLGDEWVLVSPHRTARPWQGREEDVAPRRPEYDPGCYLCPGNPRASGDINPPYRKTHVFTNDFAALEPDAPLGEFAEHELLTAEGVQGTCRVICFSPRHDLTLAEVGHDGLRTVIDLWVDQTDELGADYRWVQVFENKGEIMGASNPHPHGQIWAGSALPTIAAVEDRTQREYRAAHGTTLLADYVAHEVDSGRRLIAANDEWAALVPYWAQWPFEALVVPRRPAARLTDLDDAARDGLAEVLDLLLVKYDNLFGQPFPYSMGWHGAPSGDDAEHWTVHAHYHPPLLRSATIRKFMVGYEMFAEAQRDLTPENAALQLRSQKDIHHRFFGGR